MIIQRRDSNAPEPLLRLAEGLVAYYQTEEALERACRALWPAGEIYKGNTHWRVMPEGQTMHIHGRPDFYVDLVAGEDERADATQPQGQKIGDDRAND